MSDRSELTLADCASVPQVVPDFLDRPWTLDADHIDARKLRVRYPASTLVWCGGAAAAIAIKKRANIRPD